MTAISAAGFKAGAQVAIALDPAVSEMYDSKDKKYHFHKSDGKKLSSEQDGGLLGELGKEFPNRIP